jgi:hypothetical protein
MSASPTRLLRLCPAPPHLGRFREVFGLDHLSFDAQLEQLRAENFLLPGGWSAAMAAQGYDVFETILGDAALQKSWAREHGLAASATSFEILIEQVRTYQPEVIFIYAGAFAHLSRAARDELRAVCRERVFVSGLWGDELPSGFADYCEFLGDLDLVFCANSAYQKKLQEAGIPAVVLGNCFDDTIAYNPSAVRQEDLVFCGTTGFGYPDHIHRYEQLRLLMARTRLAVWAQEPRISYGAVLFARPVLMFLGRLPRKVLGYLDGLARWFGAERLGRVMGLAREVNGDQAALAIVLGSLNHPRKNYFLTHRPLGKLFPGRIHDPLLRCSDYYSLLSGSKLVLNIHRDEDADYGNIRCFEATGLGACLVTDRGGMLAEFFDVENDIVAFDTIEECLEKISYLLAHPEEIERIAARGQRATLSRHTVGARCRTIAETLRKAQISHNFP